MLSRLRHALRLWREITSLGFNYIRMGGLELREAGEIARENREKNRKGKE